MQTTKIYIDGEDIDSIKLIPHDDVFNTIDTDYWHWAIPLNIKDNELPKPTKSYFPTQAQWRAIYINTGDIL